jgi:hypothetical protein
MKVRVAIKNCSCIFGREKDGGVLKYHFSNDYLQ